MTERFDKQDRDWPARPWIMAAIGALGGLVIHLLSDGHTAYDDPFPVWKQAAIAFTVIATISFLLTVELRRWAWSVAFALSWGAVIALVGWFTAQYNRNGEIMEFPFLSGILAVLIAAPLFQTFRDEGAWRFPYGRLHRHAWTDAVIGAASLLFTGITFLLAWLIASLFDVIGIDAIKELLKEDWFSWMLAGFAFGGAIGLLRERDALAATMQKLAMVVLSVLAPVLAVALAAFLASLPFTGLTGLWESDIPATPMLLLSGAGAILLANAVIGDGRAERSPNIWLQRSAMVLVACVLPLALLAALSMGERINQYGWTPERIWGVVAVLVAIAYGAAAWWAIYMGRQDYDEAMRPLQTKLAIGLTGLALFLALPILDFGAISSRSQVERLAGGKVSPADFDWRAMAFDFGPQGRKRLADLARSGPTEQREAARATLAAVNPIDVMNQSLSRQARANLQNNLRIFPESAKLSPKMREELIESSFCRIGPCIAVPLDEESAVLVGNQRAGRAPEQFTLYLESSPRARRDIVDPADPVREFDIANGRVEVRTIPRRQIYIDGQPVGAPFE